MRGLSYLPLLAGLAVLPACVGTPAPGEAAKRMSPAPVMSPPLRHPRVDLVTGGQPAAADWSRLRQQGVSTVINLRTDAEMRGRAEADKVAAAGMAYQRLPIAGAADIDAAHADELWQRIEAATGPVLVHCASGNRVGALLAIGAARHAGMSPAEAMAFGRKAGLTRLEPRVREVLGLSPVSARSP